MKRNQGSRYPSRSHGFTRVELVISIAILGILFCLLSTQTRGVNEAARRASCMNNMRQLVLSQHNYESVHEHFPAAMGKLNNGASSTHQGADRLSGLVLILPFMEQTNLWQQITKPSEFNGIQFPAGPAPWIPNYPPWQTEIAMLRCPSDNRDESDFGQTNYAFCIGDMARDIHQPKTLRGAFACQLNATFDDLSDGSSNTIAMAEIGTSGKRLLKSQFATNQPLSILDDPSQCLQLIDASDSASYDPTVTLGSLGRGGCWADGAAGVSLFNTVLPPNSPSAAVGSNQAVDGIYSAGSSHPDGTIVVMCDGSAHYISNEIDAGDPGQPTLTPEQMTNGPTPSPYGIWGALGTASGEEEWSISDM